MPKKLFVKIIKNNEIRIIKLDWEYLIKILNSLYEVLIIVLSKIWYRN
jgi:hypothetical protein